MVAAAVKQEMKPGGRYEFVQGKDLDTVNQRLGDIARSVRDYQHFSEDIKK